MAVDAAQTLRTPRILIIRRDNIGDLACTTPLLAGLRAQLPRAWLGALVTTYNAEVLARNPALDEIFVYEKLKHRSGGLFSHLRSRLGQLSRLRQRQLDCVLVPAPSPQSLKLARGLKPGRVLAAPTAFPAALHEVERVFELGRSLGVTGSPGPLELFPDLQKKQELARQIGNGPFDIDLVFAPDGIESFDAAFRNAERIDNFPIMSIADIIASKRAAGRKRDLLEIPLLEEFRKVYEAAKPGGIREPG